MSSSTPTPLPDLSKLKVSSMPPPAAPVRRAAAAPLAPPASPTALPASADEDELGYDEPEDMMSYDPPPLEKSPETREKEEELRVIISLYKLKFPEELAVLAAELDPMVMARMDVAELESLRNRCDRLLGAGSGCDNQKKAFNACLFIIEKLATLNGLQCGGLTATLLADKEYQKDVTRLALRYLSGNACRPEIAVLMKVATVAIQLHAQAEARAGQQTVESRLVAPDGATANKIAELNTRMGGRPDNVAAAATPGPSAG